MFESFFLSKTQKLVEKWLLDHEQMIEVAHEVMAEYTADNHTNAKIKLKKLKKISVQHCKDEDSEFIKLLQIHQEQNDKIVWLIEEFIDSFKETRIIFITFLTEYTQEEAVLDEAFLKTFKDLILILKKRMSFEEENLYEALSRQ